MRSLEQYVHRRYSPVIVNKAWGYEEWIVNNDEYCGKKLFIKAGHKFSMHFHADKHETFYVVEGACQITLQDTISTRCETFDLLPGDSVEVRRLVPHQVTAIRDTTIMEFSTHHEDSDSYRTAPGDSQK